MIHQETLSWLQQQLYNKIEVYFQKNSYLLPLSHSKISNIADRMDELLREENWKDDKIEFRFRSLEFSDSLGSVDSNQELTPEMYGIDWNQKVNINRKSWLNNGVNGVGNSVKRQTQEQVLKEQEQVGKLCSNTDELNPLKRENNERKQIRNINQVGYIKDAYQSFSLSEKGRKGEKVLMKEQILIGRKVKKTVTTTYKTTLKKIKKHKKKSSTSKSARPVYSQMEKELVRWIKASIPKIKLTHAKIRKTALCILKRNGENKENAFKASNGWMEKFLFRHEDVRYLLQKNRRLAGEIEYDDMSFESEEYDSSCQNSIESESYE